MAARKELTDDLRLAHVLADNADSITLARFRAQDLRVEHKPDLSEVTDADTAVEETIRRTLSRSRPRDAVHGEEGEDTGWGPRRWVCLLYTSDAADEEDSVDLGGRRIIKT